MPVSTIDTLMQIAAPTRPIEPPRGGNEPGAFGPALEQAYGAEKAREAATPAEEYDEAADARLDVAADSQDADDHLADEADGLVAEESAQVEETGEQDKESSGDAVEISGQANAAAAGEQARSSQEVVVSILHATKVASGESADPAQGVASQDEDHSSEGDAKASVQTRMGLTGDAEGGDSATAREVANPKVSKSGMQGTAVEVVPSASKALDAETREAKSKPQKAADVGLTLTEEHGAQVKSAELPKPESANDAGGERINVPIVEPTAELAAAIERHVAMMEQIEGRAATSADLPAADAVSTGASSQRTAATLDRLAAASLRRGEDSGAAENGPQIDRPRFLQRVEGALKAAQQRDGRIQVRLAPPELGALRIELSVQNGAMTAKLEAETPAARNALLDNLPALRERLAEQNIRVEKFDVDLRRDSQGGGGNSGSQDGRTDHHESGSYERRGRAAAPQSKVAGPRVVRTLNAVTDAGLDVRI